jgi:hypothetical protein
MEIICYVPEKIFMGSMGTLPYNGEVWMLRLIGGGHRLTVFTSVVTASHPTNPIRR